MTMTPATHAYIGTAACGCVVAVVADTPELIRDTAKTVYGFLLDGLAVTRVEADRVKDLFRLCPHQTENQPTSTPHLYEVHHFIRSYALATDEEEAEEIMEDVLIERVAEGPVEVMARHVTSVPFDALDTIPWTAEGESRTCREIIADAEIAAKQITMALESRQEETTDAGHDRP